MRPKYLIILLFTYLSLYSSSINILDTKTLDVKKINNLTISELSALAYDKKNLYALSDQGNLFRFELDYKNKKINFLKLVSGSRLKNKKDKFLKKNNSDAEGMVYVDNKLLISFERKPRIEYFSLDAKKIKKAKINKQLLEKDNYLAKNKMLEAVAYNSKYGVITSPEKPLKQFFKSQHALYTKNSSFALKACGNITALEFISEDEILILFRDMQFVIYDLETLSIEYIKSNNGFKDYSFEGLTKLDDNLYLVVSDNNDLKTQKTLFVLFEILD